MREVLYSMLHARYIRGQRFAQHSKQRPLPVARQLWLPLCSVWIYCRATDALRAALGYRAMSSVGHPVHRIFDRDASRTSRY